MKKITLLLFVFIYGAIQAQIIDFPDENLKNALLNHNPTIDTNNNNEIEISEAANFNHEHLNLQFKGITDITGLENFTSIEKFIIGHNDITSADISVLPWAKDIGLNGNELTEIDISSNLALEVLTISNNDILDLDISNNIDLVIVRAGGNELTEIDLSSNLALEELYINNNDLSSIDISNNTNLLVLNTGGNNLTTLDTSNNLALESLNVFLTDISTLDLSLNNLKSIDISGALFTNFDDFNSQIELENIDVGSTQISILDTSIFPSLKYLATQFSDITELDLSQNLELWALYVGYSGMTTVDISNNLDLRSLIIWQGLTSIDVSQNLELRSIQLSNSNLTSLDLSNNNKLCYVTASNTDLEYINIKNGNNTNLDPDSPCSLDDSGGGIGGVKFRVDNNDNLAVICVDELDYALANFNVPDSATLLESCPGSLGDTNQLTGTISYDENNDGCDPNDQAISTMVHSTDGVTEFATIAELTGDFNIYVLEGVYDTQVLGLPNYFATDPIIHQNTFTGFGQTENIDYCITATTNLNDLSVTLIPTSEARPGFEANYQIIYTNIGTTTVSGSVDLTFDDALVNLELANPVPTNNNGNILSWDFTDLQPLTSRTIDITMLVEQPPTVVGDDILQYIAAISPNNDDQTPDDNTFELNQIVVNSYDPNDKTCLEGEEVLIEDADEYLHYLIRFQNTGTASAINVRVADQLDEKLDWTTLVIESLSHPGRTEIMNGRDISFIFDDINLPHEDADPEGSNGFISYKIKPKEDVVLGDTIENTAYIFFDFNPPIITNTTETTFVETLAIDDSAAITLEVYPNPTSDILYINSNEPLEKLTIYNSLGQSIKTKDLEGLNSQIDMSNLDRGIYFISLQAISGASEYKQIIKK
ncbi:hypothetical protein GCM10011344_14330 [Dokdonia pacifica]|nr:T9SS type A sorting domain-containing protein [Dokdonia pacifica]GGG14850.1 hypothetical protein GCM10011344_14330 [Dokdonia pacifica]